MTKKKKSIISDQRFIVLLVIIALSAVFSIMSKEFRQYTTLLSMLDFSFYDLLPVPIVSLKMEWNHPPSCVSPGHGVALQREPAPRVIIHVQRVARNGGRFITPISTPFSAPTAIPSTRQSSIAAATGNPWLLTIVPAISA